VTDGQTDGHLATAQSALRIRVARQKSRFATNIGLYLGTDAR